MENEVFLLVELEDLSSIFTPLKTASRIKYTCFTVSNNFLIFGATSGGLYIFRREPCCFLQLLPNKEGSVTHVAISPNEKLIAFSTIKGIVCILERSFHSGKHLVTTTEHQNEQVTYLQWNEKNDELFVGDNSGKVSIITLSIFPSKSMFQTPSFVLMQLDSKIVQMDFNSNMLLVSTLTKCYICDTTKEIFRQVGHKLRDGEYGACIFNTQADPNQIFDSETAENEKSSEYSNLSHLKLLCARPGSRVWEVTIDGTVISTHHFKEALAVPPRKIFFLNHLSSQSNDCNNSISTNGSFDHSEQICSNFEEQSFNFQKLYILLSKFFFTFKSDGIYIFDPQKAAVVLWNNEITNIVDVKCVDDVIYIWSGYKKMYALNLVSLEKFLVRLYFQKKYSELAKFCLEFKSFLITQVNNCSKLYVLHDLDEKLNSVENLKELCDPLKPLISLCKEHAQKRKSQNAQKLKSGIYVIGHNDKGLLDDKRIINQKLLRPNYLNVKSRSHSVSPERLQNGELKRHGSTSLPDLVKDKANEENLTSEIVVNGEKKKENNIIYPKAEVESVLKICNVIKHSVEPSNELIFSLFDQILALSECKTKNNLELVQSLPLNSYFSVRDFTLISDIFHSSLRSKLIFEWLVKFKGDWLTKAIENYPEFLFKNYSIQSLELDFKLSKILKLFSDVLREAEIVDLIKETEMECYYASLVKILDIYHDSSLSSVSLSDLNITNATSIPKMLNIVYFLINVGQIEQCSKYSYKINLHDIFYLMLKFEESSRKCGKSNEIIELQCHTMFLSYLDKAHESSELLIRCKHLIENYVINCLENINYIAGCVREANCKCGFPCSSFKPSIKMFPNIGQALVDKNWPKNPAKCFEICSRIPYLWNYFILIRRNEPLNILLPLLLQSGEMQELESRSLEINEELLESCITYLIKLKSGNCLNCGEKIKYDNRTLTWTEFGMLCVKLLGPRETILLFSKHARDISSRELDQSFYQVLIFSSIMEKHSKGLRKSVVDLLTGKGKQQSDRVPVFSEKLKTEIFGKECTNKYNLQNNETDIHHWGVKINFKDICSICCLPLETKVLISEAGLVAFKCAHAFHSACLKKGNLECPFCKNKNTNEEPNMD